MEELIKRFLTIEPGSGSGSGSGDGSGSGYGDGSGSGYGVKSFNGKPVYEIDEVQTIIESVRGNIARGYILQSDLTLTPCYIVKGGSSFAHGKTLREAQEALESKLFDNMPEGERIEKFIAAHPDAGKAYSAQDLFEWHHRLTTSCLMGRESFCRDKGIDVDKDAFTVAEFIGITESAYGGGTVRKLRERYAN